MKIRLKLSILFTALAGAILLLFALVIYLTAASDRRSEFYIHLSKEAMTRANVLFDAGVDPETLQTIYLQNREILSEVEVAIYDPHFNLLYHDAEDIDFVKETPEMIDEIMETGEVRFVQEGWEVIGIRYSFNDTDYAITAAAYDEYGHSKLQNLRNTLGVYWAGGVLLIFLAGVFYARRALLPVSRMITKAEDISVKNLDLRLDEGNGKDELAELAITFNRMLDRLEHSFRAQKEFVSNISHELRTPLSAIIGEIELALSSETIDAKQKQMLQHLLSDGQRLSKLTNDLLELAKASYDPLVISQKEIRLDEIIVDARHKLLAANNEYKVDLFVDIDSDEDAPLSMQGNAYFLEMAFLNIMHNACKFSEDHSCSVHLKHEPDYFSLSFADKGIGISKEDMPHIFEPFFRGKNHNYSDGSGIGLSLVMRILKLHRGSVEVTSSPGEGSTFTVRLPVKHNVSP